MSVGYEKAITIPEFQLQKLSSSLDSNSNDGIGFSLSIPAQVHILWKCMQSGFAALKTAFSCPSKTYKGYRQLISGNSE